MPDATVPSTSPATVERLARGLYNTLRPHEALDDRPPVTRWRPSAHKRPAVLPEVSYHRHAALRTVGHAGTITYRRARILCGRGIAGQAVRIEECDHELAVYYAWKQIRLLSTEQLARDTVL